MDDDDVLSMFLACIMSKPKPSKRLWVHPILKLMTHRNQVASFPVTWFFRNVVTHRPPVASCVVWKAIPLKIHADKKACGLRQHLLQVKFCLKIWSLDHWNFGFGVSASHTNLCISKFSSLFLPVIKSLATCYWVLVCHRLYANKITGIWSIRVGFTVDSTVI